MKRPNITILSAVAPVIVYFLALAGCGSNGNGFLEPKVSGPGPVPGPTNSAPVANAGVDQYVSAGTTVTLDGSKSYDPDGTGLTYSWRFDSKPASSSAVLSNASSMNPTFRADRVGVYAVSLTVSDGKLTSNHDTVNISAHNDPPVANAGPDQVAAIDDLVTLDGSGSYDPNGDPLTYSWTMLTPWNSKAVLSDNHAIKPTFTPDITGPYTFYLAVNDGTVSSTFQDTVVVAVSLTAVADAGPDQYKTTGPSTVITLDGSGSHDSAGRPMTYAWSFTREPAGSTATLSDPSSVSPTFTADVEGKYELSLQIFYNGLVNSLPDYVTVVVITNRPITGLPFNVIDAEYSKQLDRLIMVSGTPANQLHIYDPVTDTDQAVDLSALPTCVSVSPDGLYAAIGHNGMISYVDLVLKSVVTTLPADGNIPDIVLAGNGYVYAPVVAVSIGTGVATSCKNCAGIKARLHPSGLALYTTVGYAAAKYDISSGIPVYLYSSDNIPGLHYNVGNDIWLTEDGTSLITQSGNIYNASSGSTNDMMQPKTYIGVQSLHVSDSSAAAQLALIPMSQVYANMRIDDTELWIFDHYFGFLKSIALPHFNTGGSDYPGHGKFVFYNIGGTNMFVITQADAAAGLVNDFGIVKY